MIDLRMVREGGCPRLILLYAGADVLYNAKEYHWERMWGNRPSGGVLDVRYCTVLYQRRYRT
jgi:hypothetical protein